MRQAKKFLTVPSNGQISIGKQWAGREVMVEVADENRIVITSGTFIPADQATFYTKDSKAQLDQFNRWSEKTPAKKSDLSQLRKRFGRKD
ncbi:MAG: hypothetical protein HQ462_01390 [Deltaproteobacteria bacterium]|nr:hypothetical protein [Deltaproteobacteria bacterium]